MKEFTNIAFLTVKVGLRGSGEMGTGLLAVAQAGVPDTSAVVRMGRCWLGCRQCGVGGIREAASAPWLALTCCCLFPAGSRPYGAHGPAACCLHHVQPLHQERALLGVGEAAPGAPAALTTWHLLHSPSLLLSCARAPCAMKRVTPAAGGTPRSSPRALPSPARLCPAGQGGGWGCLRWVGARSPGALSLLGEESYPCCSCLLACGFLSRLPPVWGGSYFPPGKAAVPTTSPLPRSPCTQTALGRLRGSCPLLGKHSSCGGCGQLGTAPAGTFCSSPNCSHI